MYLPNDQLTLDTYNQRIRNAYTVAERNGRRPTKYKRPLQWTVLVSRVVARLSATIRPSRARTT
jgi:hypothetical protein